MCGANARQRQEAAFKRKELTFRLPVLLPPVGTLAL